MILVQRILYGIETDWSEEDDSDKPKIGRPKKRKKKPGKKYGRLKKRKAYRHKR